jgi:transposase
MNKVTIVGTDLHDRNMLLRLAAGTGDSHEKSFKNDAEGRGNMVDYLIQFAMKHKSDRIVFVYEASGQGYGLCDLLSDHGIECFVLSPSHLPKSAKGKKNKTDSKDALKLFELARAHVLANNELPIVWTPPKKLRHDRELIRTRLESAEACTRVKLQITSLLKRSGVALPDWFCKNRNWTRKFVKWLKDQAQRMDVIAPVILTFVERFEILNKQITDLDRHVRTLSRTDRYKAGVAALCELPGVGLITAMTFLTEMGDLTRFSNRRQVAAYLGLCPSSFESGGPDVDRKGHITRQGPGRVRKVLCQAAWTAIRKDEATRNTFLKIQNKRSDRRKKAVVAIMRKLAIVMWHRALGAGVSVELTAPPAKPPCWTQQPSVGQAG